MGWLPTSRFHLHRRRIRDFHGVVKNHLKALEVLEVNCSSYFLRDFVPEDSASLGRFSSANFVDLSNLYLYLYSYPLNSVCFP